MEQEQSGTALAPVDEVAGVHHSIEAVNHNLKIASERANLIAPATRVGSLPAGCGVSLAVLRVDPTVDNYGSGPDCYKVDGGKVALSKHVLDRLGAALGVGWNASESRRTDDATDPHYWCYKAVGHYRQYDGTLTPIENEYEWDVREGSPRVEDLRAKAKGNPAKEQKLDASIRQMRKFGFTRAVSGAKLRALADIGIKRSYTVQELAKPFVIARVYFDGHTDDPEEKRIFAQTISASFLGANQALFATSGPTPARALPAEASEPSVLDNGEVPEGYSEPSEAEADECFWIPSGPAQGVPLGEADLLDLQYHARATEGDDENAPLHAALVAELKTRTGDGGKPNSDEKY